jgi:hypothetical protein
MFNFIEIIMLKKKIKRHKEEIELLNIYDKHKNNCETCKYFKQLHDFSYYGKYVTTYCLIEFKSIKHESQRAKCQYYKVHKKFKKII